MVLHRTKEWYGFTDAGLQWLKDKGCEWIKLTAEPGDLLLCTYPHQTFSVFFFSHFETTD
jgi:hypothetical protein